MSMRVGDESGRARAEAFDDSLLVPEPIGTPAGRRCVAGSRHDASVTTCAAMAGLGFLVFMFLACFVGAQFAPDPNHQNLLEPTSGPSASHWFGTDELSRDVLSRVLHGGQISLKVALGVAVLSTADRGGDRCAGRASTGACSTGCSCVSPTSGSRCRRSRSWRWRCRSAPSTSVRSAPSISVAPLGITLLLSCLLWGSIARVVRGATLALREREFVDAARGHRRVEHGASSPGTSCPTAWD